MTAIRFHDVCKRYKLYSRSGLYLRDRITHLLHRVNPLNGRSPWHSARSKTQSAGINALPSAPGPLHPLERDFWALKDVSFEIKQGESVGIIGRNGAGKSTILKLLAGVTKPTSGTVLTEGRIAAMIEVGAGFHPELTGSENIYLNGSILGMKKTEIDRLFDQIVSFAELEEFIDTPVKHYSSGMFVRLGFAIAAHTNPDIYLIDEVLSVGDEAFQKKCVDVLAEHKAAGRTMIFVTHQLEKLEEICDRCIYLHHGAIRFDGKAAEAVDTYRADLREQTPTVNQGSEEYGVEAQILGVVFRDRSGNQRIALKTGDDLIVEIRYHASKRIDHPEFSVGIWSPQKTLIAGFNSGTKADHIQGNGSIFCCVREFPLRQGTYFVSIAIRSQDRKKVYDYHYMLYKLKIESKEEPINALVRLSSQWAHEMPLTDPGSVLPEPKSSTG